MRGLVCSGEARCKGRGKLVLGCKEEGCGYNCGCCGCVGWDGRRRGGDYIADGRRGDARRRREKMESLGVEQVHMAMKRRGSRPEIRAQGLARRARCWCAIRPRTGGGSQLGCWPWHVGEKKKESERENVWVLAMTCRREEERE